jgi:hypothetical protein
VSQVPCSSEKHGTPLSGGSHFAPASGKDAQTPASHARTTHCSFAPPPPPPSGSHGVPSGKTTGAHVGDASPSIVRHTPSPERSDVHEASSPPPPPRPPATSPPARVGEAIGQSNVSPVKR